MARANDTDDEPDVSSLETHFVAREDDEETLWDVREIIAEKGRMYQVLWEGVDPKTNKPWPPDWVPKEDCTDPLVLAWKRKKAAAKAERKRGRNSIQSRVSAASRTSAGSSATVTRTSTSTTTKPKPIAAGVKRKRNEGYPSISSRASRQSVTSEIVSSAPPKKKQKVTPKSPSTTTRSSSSRIISSRHNGRQVQEEEESSGDEQGLFARLRQSKPNTRPHRHSPIDLVTSSEDELPRPKARPNDVKRVASSKPIAAKSIGVAPKPMATKSTGVAPKLTAAKSTGVTPKLSLPVPKTSRPHTTITPDEAETSDTPPIRRLNNPQDGISKRSKPVHPDFSDDTSPPKPPRRNKLKLHAGGKAIPDSSPPQMSPTSPEVVKRAESPSASPSPYDSHSPSMHDMPPSPSLHAPPLSNVQDIRRDEGEDSALEYVEVPIPPQPDALQTPPSTQISHQQSLSPQLQSQPASPSPAPASSRLSQSPRRTPLQAQGSQFVSETEGEESQQPHQRFNQASPLLLRSPSKNSFTSRMKPRTPGSKKYIPDHDLIASPLPFNEDGGDGDVSPQLRPRPTKKLQPIPQISPSKFLTLPSSTIESANSPAARNKHDDSIEQFESPDKSTGNRKGGKGAGSAAAAIGTTSQEIPDSTGGSGSSGNYDGSLPVPSAATNVVDKGVAMADAAKKAKLNGLSAQARVALDAIIESGKERQRLRSVSRASDYETGEEEEEEEEEESQREGVAVQSTLEEFADSFVDYDAEFAQDIAISQEQTQDQDEPTKTEETGNIVSGEQKVTAFERQEEEESTQDVLAEMQQQQQQQQLLLQQLERTDQSEGWVHPAAPLPLSSQVLQSGDEDMIDADNSLEVAPPKSSRPFTDSLLDFASQPQPASQRTPNKRVYPSEQTSEIPPTLSPTRPGPEFLFSSSSQSQDPQLEAAMNLLNKKSEEISRLESLLAAAQTATRSLEVQNVTLKSSSAARENQLSLLAGSVQSLEAKVSFSENNADVFRRQYLEASRYASEVMAENKSLQERIEVVESQVSSGVSGIRTMFERRVPELEKEAAYHRQLATFVMEQTKRTGDEEIRRRAAEYPELEMRYRELEDKLEGAGGMINTLERLVTLRDKDIGDLRKEKREEKERMEIEIERLRDEVEKLKEVNEKQLQVGVPTLALGNTDSLPVSAMDPKSSPNLANGDISMNSELSLEPKAPTPTPRENVPGDIVVYRCLWRKDGTDRCDAMFLTKEELRCHLGSCGHLQ